MEVAREMSVMHYRQLGETGFQVSEISMGCNRLGETGMPDTHWVALVHRAVELGVNLFDTSESYGWGRSEVILGQAVGARRDILVATKVSRARGNGRRDFSSSRIVERAESSLKRLCRDCIDLYQLHSPSLDDLQHYDWFEAMTKLKEQGKIRLIGVSINDAASGRWLIEQGLVEVLQVAYNMLHPEVGDEVFPLAEQCGVGILVRMPMARGILTGKFHPGQEVGAGYRAHLERTRLPQLIERAEHFRPLTEGKEVTLAQMALRYSISPRAVSAAIPGARTTEQLEQNVVASNGVGLSVEELADVARIREGEGT